jgi:hypothetical protein
MTDVDVLVEAITRDVGDPAGWGVPVEFQGSLALCALNSAYSLRATSAAATRLLARYRAFRSSADTDSGPDLVKAMDDAGGPAQFSREVLCNESKLPGTTRVRTAGIYEGLSNLAALDVPVTEAADLRTLTPETNAPARRAWVSVSGFGPLAWSYLLMNAGVGSETKPDVMVQRYLTRILNQDTTHDVTQHPRLNPEQTRELLALAATKLAVEPRSLDRAIWLHESPSTPKS